MNSTPEVQERRIDYHLNILGVRVEQTACHLIANGEAEWVQVGPSQNLPIELPWDAAELIKRRDGWSADGVPVRTGESRE